MVVEGRIVIWRSGKFRFCGLARIINRRMVGGICLVSIIVAALRYGVGTLGY